MTKAIDSITNFEKIIIFNMHEDYILEPMVSLV